MDRLKKKKISILTFIWCIMSHFLIDRNFFGSIDRSNILNYLGCKAVAMMIIWTCLWLCFYLKGNALKSLDIKAIKLTLPIALIYFLVTVFFLYIEVKWYTVLSGDTGLIYDRALQLKCYNDFHFLTSWCYIIALMLIPVPNMVVFFKTCLWILFAFYTFYRLIYIVERDKISYFGTKNRRKWAFGSVYLVFLFLPVLELLTNCHRIYWYTIFYGIFFMVISLDYLENRALTKTKMCFLSLLVACISQWRTEGVVVWIFLLPLMKSVYGNMKKKDVIKMFSLSLAFNIMVFIPQNLETFAGRDHYSDVRLHPLYSYRMTLLLKEGLDRGLYADEIDKIDKVISIEDIDRLNEDYGEGTYADGYIRWLDGYVGVRENYRMDDYRAFVRGEVSTSNVGFASDEYMKYADACKNIFKNNIPLYLKTCLKTFFYTEKHGFGDGDGKHRFYIGDVLARIEYSLLLAAVIDVYLLIIGVSKKKYFFAFAALSVLGQAGLVFILSPGAYYKYYFPMCFVSLILLVFYRLMS